MKHVKCFKKYSINAGLCFTGYTIGNYAVRLWQGSQMLFGAELMLQALWTWIGMITISWYIFCLYKKNCSLQSIKRETFDDIE